MRVPFLAAAGFLVASLAAHADQIYTLDVGTYYGQVSFREPQLLITDTVVQEADFLSYQGSSEPLSIEIDPDSAVCHGLPSPPGGLSCFSYNFDGYSLTSFPLYTLSADGYYPYGNGFVSITETATTPELSSFALLGTGLLGVAGVVKRKVA